MNESLMTLFIVSNLVNYLFMSVYPTHLIVNPKTFFYQTTNLINSDIEVNFSSYRSYEHIQEWILRCLILWIWSDLFNLDSMYEYMVFHRVSTPKPYTVVYHNDWNFIYTYWSVKTTNISLSTINFD